MVCCWVHSSVATTNEWINLSELHSALPIQRDQPVPQREEKTFLSMTCFLSLSHSLQPNFMAFDFKQRTCDSSSVSQFSAFVFRKHAKTSCTLKHYNADFHQT